MTQALRGQWLVGYWPRTRSAPGIPQGQGRTTTASHKPRRSEAEMFCSIGTNAVRPLLFRMASN